MLIGDVNMESTDSLLIFHIPTDDTLLTFDCFMFAG
jgi:hypothetical protein